MSASLLRGISASLLRQCPGCEKAIEFDVFACRPCWFRLPQSIRSSITATWNFRKKRPDLQSAAAAHEKAKQAGVDFLRAGTRFPICPRCRHEDRDVFELGLIAGQPQVVQCEGCLEEYEVELQRGTATYRTGLRELK